MGVIPAFCMSSSSKLLLLSIIEVIFMRKGHAKVELLFCLRLDTSWDMMGKGGGVCLHISQDRAGCNSRIVSLRKTWLRTGETEMHVQMAVSRPSWTSPLPALPAWLVDRTKLGEWRVARSAHAETWSNSTWPFFSQDSVSPGNTQKDTSPRQTWYLSKNLHDRIFGPKILHTKSE